MKSLKNVKILSKKEQQSINGSYVASVCNGNPCGEGRACFRGRCIDLIEF